MTKNGRSGENISKVVYGIFPAMVYFLQVINLICVQTDGCILLHVYIIFSALMVMVMTKNGRSGEDISRVERSSPPMDGIFPSKHQLDLCSN